MGFNKNQWDDRFNERFKEEEAYRQMGDQKASRQTYTDSDEILRVKTIEIGDWDMDADDSVNIKHNVNPENIKGIHVLIRNDNGNVYDGLGLAPVATGDPQLYIGSTYSGGVISLVRLLGGHFDSINYDSTNYNRGWITLWYTE